MVGTAYVRLRLLTDTIGKDIEKSIKKSDLQNIDIKVDVDAAKADAELKATKREADSLDGKNPKITPKVDAKQAKKETSLLRDAIALLGPTIGPLGAVAAGAFGTLAASAGVAVLAVKGVQKEMKAGTTTGIQFTKGIQTLKSDLSVLEATAARGVLPGFQATVTSLNSAMPGVNHSVKDLSVILGDIGSRVVVGLVSGLQTFEPLLKKIAIEADNAAGHFQKWATGPGGAHFADMLGQEFDKVVPILVNLVGVVGKLVAAFAPVGDHILGVIGALAAAINAIPLPVLKVLADIFVTLYSANRLLALFTNLSLSLMKFGASAGVASVSMGTLAVSAAGFTAALGPVAAALLVGYTVTQTFSKQLDKIANKFATGKITAAENSDQMTALGNAYAEATGQIDASSGTLLKFALSGNVAKNGLGDFQDQLVGLIPHLKTLGLSTDDVQTAVSGSDVAFDKWIATVEKHGGATKDDIKALTGLHDAFQYTAGGIGLSQNALKKLTEDPAWGKLVTSAASVDQVAAKFNVSSTAVTQYASLLGISSDAIKNGVVTNEQLAAAVKTVSTAYNTASASGSGFLDSLAKFSTSAGTAADRAQLIGSYLKAAQGDLLGYAGAVASAYQANLSLTNSFKTQADQVKAGTLALADTEKAAINLKTGLVDVSKAGAGPLIQQLQAMQDAAMKAAEATYQHEVATLHLGSATTNAAKAASDAANVFKTQTYDALVKDAKQLGLTTKQAENLAKSYFDLPKDVATKVRAIGTDPVVSVLNQIGKQLSYLTGHPWAPKVSAPGAKGAKADVSGVNDALHGLHGKTIQVGADTSSADRALADLQARIVSMEHPVISPRIVGAQGRTIQAATGGLVQYRAAGGPSGRVVGPGSGTSDTAGLFALSNGEYVVNAMSTSRYLPLLKAINTGGMAAGGRVPASGGGFDTAAILAGIQALASALANRPVQLVAEDGGLVMARVVNNANLKNARRLGVTS